MTVLSRLEQRAAEASRRAERLDKMVTLARELGDDGLAELVELLGAPDAVANGNGNGHTTKSTPDAPRGRDAVRRIVRKRPGIWTLTELRAEMIERGWFTSQSGLEAAAKRLCEINGEGRRLGSGRYMFPADHEEVERESDPSDGAMIPLTP
ncbi:MAG: hypothetical protein ACRDNR_11130 [Gaiellaceae bacterium]